MQTGLWKDIGKIKVPSLRGLESRSPYFHDGSENDVAELVAFYDRRFSIGLSAQEIADLAAFLKAM
jgi:cytochrome c peroxidase